MTVFEAENMTELYRSLIEKLSERYDEVNVERYEAHNCVIKIPDASVFTPLMLGYRYDPAYQIAQFLWAMMGETETDFLRTFNEHGEEVDERVDMDSTLHAPFGERVRFYGQCKYAGEIINPLDQLKSVFHALLQSPKTKTANIVVYNPRYDSFAYETREGGRDIPHIISMDFHLNLPFDKRLDMTVHAREFDVLAYTEFSQLSLTLQLMASFLANSGKSEYDGIRPGEITIMCDTVYANFWLLDVAYRGILHDVRPDENGVLPNIGNFKRNDPRREHTDMNISFAAFDEFMLWVRSKLRVSVLNGDITEKDGEAESLLKELREYVNNGLCDEFWLDAVQILIAGLFSRNSYIEQGLQIAAKVYNYQLLVSFMMSVKRGIESIPVDEELGSWALRCRSLYDEIWKHAMTRCSDDWYEDGKGEATVSRNAYITRLGVKVV